MDSFKDFSFESSDNSKFSVHFVMLQTRVLSHGVKEQEFVELMKKISKNEVLQVLEYIYGGLTPQVSLLELFEKLNLTTFLTKSVDNLRNDMLNLFKSGLGSDFALIHQKETIKLHKFVIYASSELLRDCLSIQGKEYHENTFEEHRRFRFGVLPLFFEYVYTGACTILTKEDLFAFIEVSRAYLYIEGVYGEIEEYAGKWILENDYKNLSSYIQEANQRNLAFLKKILAIANRTKD